MILKLFIQNYALIKDLQLDPSPNFNTITGETGAGKSIMLGALGLLLGNRADTRVLYAEEEKCVIEGLFDVSGLHISELFEAYDLDFQNETIIRREISANGKSRAFINDTPVTLDVMQAFGNRLVDIHSQRDTYLLGSPTYQLNIIDGFAKNDEILETYRQKYKEYKIKDEQYQHIHSLSTELNKEADYNHFLLEELNNLSLRAGEQAELEEELQIIEHAEEIKGRLFESVEILDQSEYAVLGGLKQILKNIISITRYSEHFEELRTRLEACLLELTDISSELNKEGQKVDFDKGRQEEISARLSQIFHLTQKHQVSSEEELITIQEALNEKVQRVQNLDQEVEDALLASENALKELTDAGKKLTASRLAVMADFKTSLEQLLRDLAMPNAAIQIDRNEAAPTATGMDKISILFSANAGVAPDDLKKIASGGEFSRLMFAVKYLLAGKTALPTIIFDEIDSGISGEVAIKMVKMMREMALRHQVVAITHLPQIAACGDTHYFVYKENLNNRSVSKIRKLEKSEREIEIAKMIGGEHPTEISIQSARELLRM